MKKIEAVVRRERSARVLAALGEAGFDRVTVDEVYGHGNQKGITHKWQGRQIVVEYLPKTLLMLVVHDAQVPHVVEIICDAAATGIEGDGKIFISTVDEAIRIRSGTRGRFAV
ncbi:MAG: P-II family nitrogen regulator [Dehalococcoidia bacterium]